MFVNVCSVHAQHPEVLVTGGDERCLVVGVCRLLSVVVALVVVYFFLLGVNCLLQVAELFLKLLDVFLSLSEIKLGSFELTLLVLGAFSDAVEVLDLLLELLDPFLAPVNLLFQGIDGQPELPFIRVVVGRKCQSAGNAKVR